MTDNEKARVVKYYEEHGTVATEINFGIKNVKGTICSYRKQLGLTAPSRGLPKEVKLEIIKYYEENGRKATDKKYFLSNSQVAVSLYRKQLGLRKPK